MPELARLFLSTKLLSLLAFKFALTYAQTTSIALNQPLFFDTASLSSSTLSLPQSSTSQLFVSVALCDAASDDNASRFFVTNNSAVSDPGPNSAESDVYEISIGSNGMGNFTLLGGSGGVFGISAGSAEQRFEVGVSDTEPPHELLSSLPLLGDTTANQALLFSPPFLPVTVAEPEFPNYTLPDANLTAPEPPTQFPNFTLLIGPTSSFPEFNYTSNAFTDGSPMTACSLSNRSELIVNTRTNPGNVQTSLMLRDSNGWRTQWLVGGLTPVTNYTAFVLQGDTKVSAPINFVTKSASFSCPLVHSIPYCPLVSYAVALPPPLSESYDASTLPESISQPLIQYLSNFTTSLLTFPCGRDWYSPRVGCSDCQVAYRTWLCSVQLPRCSEWPSSNTTVTTVSSAKKWKFWKRDESSQTAFLSPALVTQNGSETVRNTALPEFSGNWTQLLPCLETCNAVERACPPFLQFKCPVPRFNARESYGVGYIDGDAADPGSEWQERGGMTGTAQDRWGNVWCNGPDLTP